MERERNSQKTKFWHAEAALHGLDRTFKTDKSVATFVRKARERAFLVRRYPVLARGRIVVLHDGTNPKAGYWSITIPASRRTTSTVVRCLARLIFERMDDGVMAFHGWRFAAIYLDLVQALMGTHAAALLKASYKAHGVRFKPKKKVAVTASMLARLEQARAKRETNNG